jgi:hypothetical protein
VEGENSVLEVAYLIKLRSFPQHRSSYQTSSPIHSLTLPNITKIFDSSSTFGLLLCMGSGSGSGSGSGMGMVDSAMVDDDQKIMWNEIDKN